MGIRTRLIAVTMAVGMLTAAVGTAAASAAPAGPATSAPGKTPPKDGQPGPKPGKPDGQDKAILAKVAASLHVSVQRLTTALQHLKQAVAKGTPEAVAMIAFAKELNVSVAQAKQALNGLSGEKGVPEQAVKLLAAELRISADRARRVFDDLAKLKGGKDVLKDPGFIAIAKGLGITPQRLEAALVKVKQELGAGKPKEPNGTPTR